jgi:hypothetical protein
MHHLDYYWTAWDPKAPKKAHLNLEHVRVGNLILVRRYLEGEVSGVQLA